MLSTKRGHNVERSSFNHEGTQINVTISIGGAMINSQHNAKSIIDYADRALYQSKQSGRNKTTIG